MKENRMSKNEKVLEMPRLKTLQSVIMNQKYMNFGRVKFSFKKRSFKTVTRRTRKILSLSEKATSHMMTQFIIYSGLYVDDDNLAYFILPE